MRVNITRLFCNTFEQKNDLNQFFADYLLINPVFLINDQFLILIW